MFDLEQSVAKWRQEMVVAGIKSSAILDELENHLREEVELQTIVGIDAQIAFLNGVEKIGKAKFLREQFKQAQGMDKSKQRKFIGHFYSTLLICYVLAMTYVMTRNELSGAEWCLGLTAQATLLLLSLFCWRYIPACLPAIGSRSVQSSIGLIGGVSGAVWFLSFAYFVLPRCDFDTGELVVALLWAMVPTLILPEAAFLLLGKSEGEELQTN